MARALRQQGRGFALHYGGRDASGMAYLDEVQAMPEARCWISGEPASGRMPLSEVLAEPVAGRHLYVCGPKSLIADVLDTARGLGWAEGDLHSELFAGSLEVAGETAFDAELRATGVTLHVPAGQSLLDVMVAAGLDPMFDCRRGDCVTQVLEGDAEHRDIWAWRLVAPQRLDLVGAHQSSNTMLAAGFAGFPQITKDTARTINTATGHIGVTDQVQQAAVFSFAVGDRLVQPLIEPGTSNPQYPAHRGDRMLVAMLVDEAVLHSGSLAKYRAAFFRMSRSSSKRRICARSRRISLLASSSSLACFSDLSGVTAFTHL